MSKPLITPTHGPSKPGLFPPGFWVFGYPTSSLFLGVFYYAFVQDVAYQRDYWPWSAFGDMTCLALEEFLGIYMC